MRERDLDAVEEDGYRHELSVGLLLREPPPGVRHGRVQLRLAELLSAFVAAVRLAALADDSRRFPGPPDLAVEVLSPCDRAADVRVRVHDTPLAPKVLQEGDVLDGGAVLPGFSVKVAALFPSSAAR